MNINNENILRIPMIEFFRSCFIPLRKRGKGHPLKRRRNQYD
jgi:hypothetical protein